MNTQEFCICAADLTRKPFSESFDALQCEVCGSCQFVGRYQTVGLSSPEFQYGGDNGKYSEKNYLYGKQLRWPHLELLKRDWSGRRVLEIGCFNGFFLDELKKCGADVYGFDINKDAVEVGSQLFSLTDRLDTSLDRLALNGPFDDILCIDVLEHLEKPGELLNELQNLLQTSGRVIVAGPTVERCFHDKTDFPPHHRWWFSRPGLQALLQQHGFEVKSVAIQRDGMLFVRNFIGRAITGLQQREYYGVSEFNPPSTEHGAARKLYAILSIMGSAVFTTLRISYCSTIFVAQRKCS